MEEKKEGDELDADVKVPLDSDEAAIRSYLMHGDPLQEGTIEKFTLQFWKDEPYKYAQQCHLMYITYWIISHLKGIELAKKKYMYMHSIYYVMWDYVGEYSVRLPTKFV